MKPSKCYKCHNALPALPSNFGGTGYAVVMRGSRKGYMCYDCCGKEDQRFMIEKGKNTLYLSYDSPSNSPQYPLAGTINLTPKDYKVTNWPGTLSIRPTVVTRGRHNIAGKRYDVWFPFEGYMWHGVQYGDMTQILHCKKTKTKVGYSVAIPSYKLS